MALRNPTLYGPAPDEPDTDGVRTREFCGRCHSVSAVGFFVPREVWLAVAGRHWSTSILCIRCFAALGDEKGIAWEVRGIVFYPTSLATLSSSREPADLEGQP